MMAHENGPNSGDAHRKTTVRLTADPRSAAEYGTHFARSRPRPRLLFLTRWDCACGLRR